MDDVFGSDDAAEVFEKDSKEPTTPPDDQLSEVSHLAKRQLELEAKLIEANDVVSGLVELHKEVSTNLLPDKMMEIGLSSFELDTGEKITIERGTAASITKKDQEAAFEWLRKHGHGDIIKHELKAQFGREEGELAAKALSQLDGLGVAGKLKESVNGNTLKAFVKEQQSKGVNFPDSFTLFPYHKSVIKNL